MPTHTNSQTRTQGALRHLPIKKLRNLTRNPQYLSPRQLDALKESILRDGFLAPILVRPINGGKHYEVLSGNHRMMAAREAGLKELPALIVEMDDQSARRAAINLNTVHGDPPAELLAPFLAELEDESLAAIHLEPELLTQILAFDTTLQERLAELEPPAQLSRASPTTPIVSCMCPACGKRHIRGERPE